MRTNGGNTSEKTNAHSSNDPCGRFADAQPAGANTLKVGIARDPDNLFVVLIHTPHTAPR